MSRSSAAVTIVNALPTGVGCAVGIERFVTATVDLVHGDPTTIDCSPAEAATPLVRESVRAALGQVAPGERTHAVLELRSDVPVAKGLKSSSAVATATIRALARAAGRELAPLAVAQLAAQVGRSAGVSATGAFDDALAGLRSGFVVTDNRTDRLIAHETPDRSWTAVVYIPLGRHAPAPSQRDAFEAAAAEGRKVASEALAGRFSEAMRLNTLLVERLMRYEYADLRERASAAGAVSSGVSGLGPAIAALVPRERQADVLASWPSSPGDRFAVDLTREDAP